MPTISIKKLFLVAIFAKVGSTLLGWAVGSTWILGFCVPLGIMGMYILIGVYKRDKDELSDDKFADSCYYLGFIFTISSIIVCLFDLPSLQGQLSDIAVRFGAAMVSTVLGLIVRVYLVNFRKDVYDIAKTVEDEVLEAAKALRVTLELSVSKLGEFNGIVADASKEAIARVNLSIEEAAANYSKKYDELFEQITAGNKEASEEAIASTRKASEELVRLVEEHAEGVSESTRKLNTRINDFAGDLDHRLRQITFPEEFFVDILAEPADRLKESISNISIEVEHTVSGLKGGAEKVTAGLAQIAQKSGELADTMEKSKKVIDAQQEVVGLARDQIDTFMKLAEFVGRLETSIDRMAEKNKQQEISLADMVKNVTEIVESSNVTRETVARQSDSLNTISGKIADTNSTLSHIYSSIKDLSENFPGDKGKEAEMLTSHASNILSAISAMKSDLAKVASLIEKRGTITLATPEKETGRESRSFLSKTSWFGRSNDTDSESASVGASEK